MLFTLNSIIRSTAWKPVLISIIGAVVISIITILIIHNIRKPKTFAVITAQSEIVTYNVFNPELATIYGSGLMIGSWPEGSGENLDGQCVKGVIMPAVMTSVTYQRIEAGDLTINISGKGEMFSAVDGATPFEGELIVFRSQQCGALISGRFPVWGPGKIGSVFAMRSDGPGPILISGSLEVYGRTVDVGPLEGGALYSAAAPLTIPSGGYIESFNRQNKKADFNNTAEDAALFGYVSPNTQKGLSVHLTTETQQLQLSPPGSREKSARIEIGLFAQVLNDPNVLAVQLIFLIMALILPITVSLVALGLSNHKDNSRIEKVSSHMASDQNGLIEND